MKNIVNFIIAPAVFCWCLFYLSGCKDPLIESKTLLTRDDELNLAKNTLSVKVLSEFEKPVITNGVATGVLGNVNDPNFGKTFAGFYAQCKLTSSNVSFGDSLLGLDSIVLTLKYAGQYGKFDQPVNLEVYELNQDLSSTATYHSNDAFAVKIPPIGQKIGFKPDMTDSVPVLGQILPAHIRIPLSNELGNRILLADSGYRRNDSAFLTLFKGIYVTTASSSTGNGILYIDLRSSLSGITLYYHRGLVDSLSYNMPFSGVTVNHFDNLYTGAPVYASVNSPNANGEEKMYVQAGAGIKGKVFIKNLDSLPKKIAINKAEIIFAESPSDTSLSSYLAPPLVLDLLRIDDAGQGQHLDDEGSNGFGGVRVTETVSGISMNRYHFNMKRYFQKLIQGIYHNNGFYLQTLYPYANSERVVIGNSSTDRNYQVSLVITYTKL